MALGRSRQKRRTREKREKEKSERWWRCCGSKIPHYDPGEADEHAKRIGGRVYPCPYSRSGHIPNGKRNRPRKMQIHWHVSSA